MLFLHWTCIQTVIDGIYMLMFLFMQVHNAHRFNITVFSLNEYLPGIRH